MGNKLRINDELFRKAKNQYVLSANDMKSLKNEIENAVNEIRNSWKSEAGKEFFDFFEEDWCSNMEDYINVLNHMAENMEIANNKYREIFNKANDLKI